MLSMSQTEKVRVFIGSGEASLLERKTLIHSLRKHTRRELDIYVFNGTHNSVERNSDDPFLAPMSLKVKYRNVTEFSNYRFLIPQICGHQGRAIFLDSDMVCLRDIGELFDTPMNGCDFLAKGEAYQGSDRWGLSVMLIDCAKARFNLEQIFGEIDQGLYSRTDFHQMTPKFLAHHPYRVGALDPRWNSFDYYDADTRLIHYTNLVTQPWKFPGHPYGELWFRYFREALEAGTITKEDVDLTLVRAYARQDILRGHKIQWTPSAAGVKRFVRHVKSLWKPRRAAA
jgi:lipopolysaccharide biosynthesis glycosyltransferase